MRNPVIVWLRQDLRLADQAAFAAAHAEGPVIPVYALDDESPRHRRMGGASRWWLYHSLASLDADLRSKGSRLVLRRGSAPDVLAALARETGARRIHALAHAEPWWRNAERQLAKTHDLALHPGQYLVRPGTVRNGSGEPYKIYTPFWQALLRQLPPPRPQPAPVRFDAPGQWPASDRLDHWHLLPSSPDWAGGMRAAWTPGERGAETRLDAFVGKAASYNETRNFPARPGTSSLSPHLHFGEVSVATVWHRTASAGGSVAQFLGELGWRDYAANVLWHWPDYATANAKPVYEALDWRDAPADLRAWQRGLTGYPIVDAGMRQLWATGWMHNRVRMIAASFLVKHLLIDWRAGERWFWDTLVDADHAINAVNWQWTAGTGVDAQMFVRIMAPLVQSPKFDAGDYIRRWVPELAGVPDPLIHDPPLRPKGYPAPIIGHAEARARALAAHTRLKAAAQAASNPAPR